ncbi:MAG: DUF5677 domain-containing protein [Marinifilaceae bacterium]
MEELDKIYDRLIENVNIDKATTLDELLFVSGNFYEIIADYYDVLTRVRNEDINVKGVNKYDAAILGLLVRIWKILKLAIKCYKDNDGDGVSLLDRMIIESAVTAKYLMVNGNDIIEDYRKCGYKNRLQILRSLDVPTQKNSSPTAIRLKEKIKSKLKNDGYENESFSKQKGNKWKIDGKSFYDIFSQQEPEYFYRNLFGLPSENIHGSWTESLDYHLIQNEDMSFTCNPYSCSPDLRMISPIIKICNEAFILWSKRIGIKDENIEKTMRIIDLINFKLYEKFEDLFEKLLINEN